MLIIKWILVGAFLNGAGVPSNSPEVPYVRANANAYDSEADCKKVLEGPATEQLNGALAEGVIKGFVLSCKKIELESPKVANAVDPTKKAIPKK